VIVSRQAETDLEEIFFYIATDNPIAAERFV
jgi:plasmid stabilization system protein ParE